MDIKKLIHLVSDASKGEDNIEKGAVGYYGYGFVFQDLYHIKHFHNLNYSSGLCRVGSIRVMMEDYRRKIKRDYKKYNNGYDLFLAGSVKTLVPSLKFGGFESLFNVWMFVRTPDGKRFPATFYYGASRLSIGAWDPKVIKWLGHTTPDKFFSNEFFPIINFWPHVFNKEELEMLAEALELALEKVPVSDYECIVEDDAGKWLKGIKNGRPFISLLESYLDDNFIKNL